MSVELPARREPRRRGLKRLSELLHARLARALRLEHVSSSRSGLLGSTLLVAKTALASPRAQQRLSECKYRHSPRRSSSSETARAKSSSGRLCLLALTRPLASPLARAPALLLAQHHCPRTPPSYRHRDGSPGRLVRVPAGSSSSLSRAHLELVGRVRTPLTGRKKRTTGSRGWRHRCCLGAVCRSFLRRLSAQLASASPSRSRSRTTMSEPSSTSAAPLSKAASVYRGVPWQILCVGIISLLAPGLWNGAQSLGAGGALEPYLVRSSTLFLFSSSHSALITTSDRSTPATRSSSASWASVRAPRPPRPLDLPRAHLLLPLARLHPRARPRQQARRQAGPHPRLARLVHLHGRALCVLLSLVLVPSRSPLTRSPRRPEQPLRYRVVRYPRRSHLRVPSLSSSSRRTKLTSSRRRRLGGLLLGIRGVRHLSLASYTA